MKGLYNAAICACAALLFANVAQAHNEYSNVHRLGLASALGDNLRFTTVYDHNQVPLFSLFSGGDPPDSLEYLHTGWDVDGFINREIAQALDDRFAVVNVDSTPFRGVEDTPANTGRAELEQRVRALSPDSGVDAYVVVHALTLHPMGENGFANTGLEAMHTFGVFGGHGEATLLANFRLSVFDSRSGERIDYGTGKAIEFCRVQILADTVAQLTPVQIAMLKRVEFQMIHDELPPLLHSAGLISYDNERAMKARPLSDADAPKPEGFDALGCNDEFPP